MKKTILIATIFVTTLPAFAQIDWLGNHLETQRWDNMRRHQQEMAKGKNKSGRNKARKRQSTRKASIPKIVERPVQVQVNRKMLPDGAIQRGGHTFVPIRSIFEAMGATVTYDSQTRMMTAQRDNIPIRMKVETETAATAHNNGDRAFVRNGVMMVPLRMLSERMGAQIAYSTRRNTPLVSITTKS